MRDGGLRRVVKAVALAGFRANLAAWRGWRRRRGDRPYRLGGSCNLCAQCGEAPAIKVSRDVPRLSAHPPRPGASRHAPRRRLSRVRPGAEALLRELRRRPLTADQDAKLRKGLHLDA